MKANQSLSVGYARVDITPEESDLHVGYGLESYIPSQCGFEHGCHEADQRKFTPGTDKKSGSCSAVDFESTA